MKAQLEKLKEEFQYKLAEEVDEEKVVQSKLFIK